jgi:hypothetical protein
MKFKVGDHVEAFKASGNVYEITFIQADDAEQPYRARRLRGGKRYGPTRRFPETSLALTNAMEKTK